MANTSQKQRLGLLDGLKGLSILTIIIYYFYQHQLPGGYLAVNTFLFIAGFLNLRQYAALSMEGKRVRLFAYYKHKVERLFFPMLAMILVSASFILLVARDALFNLRNMSLTSLFFVNNIYQIFNQQSYFVQAANPSPYTHLWYVSLLAQLIFLTPLLNFLLFKWHKRPTTTFHMLAIISVVSVVLMAYLYKDGEDPTALYYGLFTRLFAYTAGGAVGMLLPMRLSAKPLPMKVKWLFNGIGTGLLILMFLMSKFMYGTQPFAYRFGMGLYTLAVAVFVLVTIHPSTLWHRVLSMKPLTFLGKRSYSYYLWFYPIYVVVTPWLQNFGLPYVISQVIQLLLLVLLAELSYQLFERKVWSMPIGQDFNIKKTRYQLRYLKGHKGKLNHIKGLTIAYVVMMVVGFIAVAAAPEGRGDQAKVLADRIAANKTIAKETQSAQTQTIKVVNNIEGLTQEEMLYANGLEITFVGDSILLASADALQTVFPKAIIDGQEGRQLYDSKWTLDALNQKNLLKPVVVTILGANGTFTPEQLNDYIAAIGEDKDIYFITTNVNRSWVADANRQLLAGAQRFGNVHIIDWASYSTDHADWLWEDKVHPNEEGAQALSLFITKELYRMR